MVPLATIAKPAADVEELCEAALVAKAPFLAGKHPTQVLTKAPAGTLPY